MPNHEEHCQESLKRYGKTFSELHTWMDEPSAILGASHRKYRHDPNTTPLEAKRMFGENADNACLDHIRLDELYSRRKGFGRTPIGSSTQSEIPASIAVGFLTIFFLAIGFILLSSPIAWMAIPLFIASIFFLFIFIASLIPSNNKENPTSQPIEKPQDRENTEKPPLSYEQVTKRCSKCGANYFSQHEKCPYCGAEFQKSENLSKI